MSRKERNPTLCRTCLQLLKQGEYHRGNYAVNGCKTIQEQLSACFPDLNLNATSKFSLCFLCLNRLTVAYTYFELCMNVENRIQQCISNGSLQAGSHWNEFSKILNANVHANVTAALNECKQVDVQEKPITAPDVTNEAGTYPCVSINPVLINQTNTTKEVVLSKRRRSSVLAENVIIVDDSDDAKSSSGHSDNCQNSGIHTCDCVKNTPTFKCLTCSNTFRDSYALHSHSLTHDVPNQTKNPPKRFKCSKCPTIFKSTTQFSQHFVATHMEDMKSDANRAYKCKLCGLSVDKSKFKEHYRTHLTCLRCGQQFKYLVNLHKHKAMCNVTNSINGDLQNVNSPNMSKGGHRYRCDNCFDSFDSDEALQVHLFTCNKITRRLRPSVLAPSRQNSGYEHEWINYDEQPVSEYENVLV